MGGFYLYGRYRTAWNGNFVGYIVLFFGVRLMLDDNHLQPLAAMHSNFLTFVRKAFKIYCVFAAAIGCVAIAFALYIYLNVVL
ncbi:MAG: hypothetical protein EB121_03615 [Alphaproteobacteria bacterium]|nr:hypothetical protein [Alphaproteobacteria bacterium]NDG04421.1 hypothetical protein [Alphaproteobacteria bacterium]